MGQTQTPGSEIQQRVCRCCNQTYRYPLLRSQATRFYCADCVELPDSARIVIERLNKRVKQLSTQLDKLSAKMA